MAGAETLSGGVPEDVEALAIELLKAACDRDLKLATAESCTGGLISSLLTDVDGMGHAFERGFTVYTEEAKAGMLGVPRGLIDTHGAVSKEVALAMANGALAHSRADIAVSVTGFAGRGAPEDEPGLVHFACIRRGRTTHHREEHFGDIGRGAVRCAATRAALEMMLDAVD
ncbi:CinA family protein [Sphingomonas sp. ID1715]|uniref:CinA family protein n=1 Tax=Sphingomonas sp. ID1715 TaxID=1656898 RepID=UPI001487EB71|nr:CinA family protein [Sphingomonas sp. ID1715]NNM75829.1 CinA family protein [Sphingomonas sp. ID1715]